MTPARQVAARSLVWTGLESAFLSGISLLALLVFAGLLSPAEIGVVTVGLGIVQLLNVLVEGLYQDALIQQREVEERHFDTAFTASLLLALLLAGACWAGSGPVAAAVGIAELGPVLAALGLCLIPSALIGPLTARLRRGLEFRTLALRSLAGRVGGAALGIAAALAGAGSWALVLQQAAMVTIGALVLWILSAHRPRLRFSWRHFRDLAGFGLRAVAVAFAELAGPRVFAVLVGATLGAAAAGYLDIAFRVIDMLRGVAGTAALQLALPLFRRYGTSPERLGAGFAEATRFTCVTTFPVFAGMAICAPELVELLFGPAWAPSIPYVALLAVLVLPHFARLYAVPTMAAAGAPQAALPSLLAGIGIIALGMLAIGWMSLPVAAGVWAGRLLVTLPLDAWMLRRVAGIGYRVQLGAALRPLLAALLMAGAVLATRVALLDGQGLGVRILGMIAAGVPAYGLAILLLDRAAVQRLGRFIRSALQRPDRAPGALPAAGEEREVPELGQADRSRA